MQNSNELCACGKPLHYTDPAIQRMVERMVTAYGAEATIIAGKRIFLVPKHYIALHGIKTIELPALAKKYGWREVTDEARQPSA